MFAWQRRLEKKHEASPKNEANIALPHTGKQWSQMETALRKRKPENIAGMESLMQELHGETPKFGYKALERAISEMGKEGEAFFKTTLPFIQSLVLELPRCFTSGEMRILRQNHAARVRLSCRQLLCCSLAHSSSYSLKVGHPQPRGTCSSILFLIMTKLFETVVWLHSGLSAPENQMHLALLQPCQQKHSLAQCRFLPQGLGRSRQGEAEKGNETLGI
mmetsp:Transcript_32571/g.79245  ORF Transcript_32571/g.79245 Transcript_32571/m.79245 type:complete len:219 (-) Transcript_32571:1000-1656(-)